MADSRGRSAEILAMDYSSGEPEEIWRAEFKGLMFSSPILDAENEKIFLMTTGGFGTKDQGTNSTVYCISMADGSEEWSSQVDGASFSSLAYDNEKICYFLPLFGLIKKKILFRL